MGKRHGKDTKDDLTPNIFDSKVSHVQRLIGMAHGEMGGSTRDWVFRRSDHLILWCAKTLLQRTCSNNLYRLWDILISIFAPQDDPLFICHSES